MLSCLIVRLLNCLLGGDPTLTRFGQREATPQVTVLRSVGVIVRVIVRVIVTIVGAENSKLINMCPT